MASKLVRRRGVAPVLVRIHEQTALAGLVAIAVHGVTLFADPWLRPGVSGVLVPFTMGYRPLFTGLGIVAGYLAALLGLSFYARRRIGARLWRKLHRATVLVWALGVVHALGAGTRRGVAVAARVHAGDRRPDRGAVRNPDAAPAAARPRDRPRPRPGGSRMSDGIVIAGGGLAAQRCAETLRSQGYDGAIRIVCAEPHPPYDRPPLSKELLTGALPPAAVALRPSAWYEQRRVDLLLGARAVGIDPVRRRLELERGAPLRYDALLIATGSRARTLPALEGYDNVRALRTLDDALALARAPSRRASGSPWSAPASSGSRRRPRRSASARR